MPAMGPQPSEEELKVRATEALEALARAAGAKGHIWMVIKGDGGKIGGCSPSLRPYGAALMDEVEKATEKPVIVTSKREPSGLLKAEKVLHTLAKTKHVELHPIVATMIQGLNEINNHKHPRILALTDPSTMPAWFPFPPAVYAPRAQKMDLHQLFHVMDVIFAQVRGNLHAIQTLHAMLDRVYKSGSCSIGTRAGIDSFFEFLEDEAIARMGKAAAPGGVKEEALDDVIPSGALDDVIPSGAASETSAVGGEGDGGAEAGSSRKRARSADAPLLPSASPGHSGANSTPPAGAPAAPEDEIDFEKYMSGEGAQFLAEFDALTRPQPEAPPPFWDAAPDIVPAPMAASDLSVAFDTDVHIEESGPGAHVWDFRSSGELTHSTGQSTLGTDGSDALLQPNGGAFPAGAGNVHNATPTSARNWTPEWFAGEPGDSFPHADAAPRQHGAPLLGNDEAVVRARLQQQMHLAEQGWPAAGFRSPTDAADSAAGGQDAGFRAPPEAAAFPPRLNRNDGLSESMRRDFLPQQGGLPHGTYNGDYVRLGGAPNGMEPRMRPVGLAMARAPSFSPSPSLQERAPRVSPQAAQPQAPKPGGILHKAKGLIAGGPPKRIQTPPGKVEPFPYSRSDPVGRTAAPQSGGVEPLGRSRSGDQPPVTLSGPLPGRKDSGERDRKSFSGPVQKGGANERSLSGEGREPPAAKCVGENSGKALKVLGIDDHGSFGGSSGWSGSQDGSGSFDGDGEGPGAKKGLARFLPKLGRGKGKAAKEGDKSPRGDPALYRDRSWDAYSTGSGVSGDVPLSKRSSGEVVLPEHSPPRQAAGPVPRGPFPGPDGLYAPPGGECEAFPLARDVQRFDSFQSDGSLAPPDEPESDACESFPFRRGAPPRLGEGSPSRPPAAGSEGIQRLMQRLTVTEAINPMAGRAGAVDPARPAPLSAAAVSVQRSGVGAEEARANGVSPRAVKEAGFASQENGVSPRSILTGGPPVGTPGGGVSEGDAYDEEDSEPKSPAFALGIGTGDEFDFDDDTSVPNGRLVRPSAREPIRPAATVVSVKIVNDASVVTALPVVPVAKLPGAPGAKRGVAAAVPGVQELAPVQGRASEDAVHDDMLERLQRLKMLAHT